MESNEKILEGVLREFYGLCAIPHPSGKEEKICAYLWEKLLVQGLVPEVDAAYNLICDVPATLGLENRPRIALQAHMDMVTVGRADYVPETDAIQTKLEDGYLKSDGRSTLGADCGIGLAVALYLVEQKTPHGPLRLIFTSDEERGLRGAQKIRQDCLRDCAALINLDGFHFDKILISSAGGLRQTFRKETERFFPMLEDAVELRVSGLRGGHSGDDIHLGRGNAAMILVWLLQSLEIPYELSAFHAGGSHNAIAASGSAVITMDPRDRETLEEVVSAFRAELKTLYAESDPEIQLDILSAERPLWVLTLDERDNLLALSGLIPCGAAEMHPLCPEVVGSSCNLGVVRADENNIVIQVFQRSVQEDTMRIKGDFYAMAAEGFGYLTEENGYAAWPGVGEDPLSAAFMTEAAALGHSMEKTAVHVGLEPSVFHAMAPEIPMVAVGMDVLDPHSTLERVKLDTIVPFTKILANVLERVKL